QAEDGIRDATVTGVQTCALPIWKQRALQKVVYAEHRRIDGQIVSIQPRALRAHDAGNVPPLTVGYLASFAIPAQLLQQDVFGRRSEERRVGKECRAGVWASGGRG